MNDDQHDDSRVHIKGRRRHALPTAEQHLLQQRARDRLEPTPTLSPQTEPLVPVAAILIHISTHERQAEGCIVCG